MSLLTFRDSKGHTFQAFWVGLGSLSSFAMGLISAAILSRYLSKPEYGTYKQILYVYNTLLVVFTAGLPRVYSYFLPRFTLAQGREIVAKITKVLFISGFVFSVFLFLCSGLISDVLNNPELSKGLKYFSPVPMLMLPTLGIEGIFTTYKKSVYIAIYNTVTRILMLFFIVVPVVVFSGSYIMALYGWLAVSVIILLIAFYFKGVPFKGTETNPSGLGFREILAYSLPLMSATIAGAIYRAANQFYISRYFGTEIFADFSNGFIEIPLVHMITGATSSVLMPVFSKKIYEKSDISEITDLWRNAIRKSAILIYPMVIFFMFYSRELVTIVYSEIYSESSIYFSIAMIMNFFNIIIFAPLLLSIGEQKFYARLHYGLAITTWLTEFLVVIVFNSPVAIAVTFVVISIGGILISLVYSAKKLKITFLSLFPIRMLSKIATHSLLTLLVIVLIFRYLFPEINGLPYVIISGIIYLILLLVTGKWISINYLEIVKPLMKINRSPERHS